MAINPAYIGIAVVIFRLCLPNSKSFFLNHHGGTFAFILISTDVCIDAIFAQDADSLPAAFDPRKWHGRKCSLDRPAWPAPRKEEDPTCPQYDDGRNNLNSLDPYIGIQARFRISCDISTPVKVYPNTDFQILNIVQKYCTMIFVNPFRLGRFCTLLRNACLI